MAYLSSSREHFSIPRDQRQNREAQSEAAYAQDDSQRAAWRRAMETLPYMEGGADVLEKIVQREMGAMVGDPSTQRFRRLGQARDASERAKSTAQIETNFDLYGTADPHKVLEAQLSGGIYRDPASINRLLSHDPAKLAGELRAQQPKGETPAPEMLEDTGAPGGTFSTINRADTPTVQLRTAALTDLLGIAEDRTTRKAEGRGGGSATGARAQARFAADQFYTELAGKEGVARAAQEIRARAAADPTFARFATQLLTGLNARAVTSADKDKFGRLADRSSGALRGQYLPGDEDTIAELRRMFGDPTLGGPPAPASTGPVDELAAPPMAPRQPTPAPTPGGSAQPQTGMSPRASTSPQPPGQLKPPGMSDEEFLMLLLGEAPGFPPVRPGMR